MVLIIGDKHVTGDISAENLFTDFPDLKTQSESLFNAAPRTVRAEERHVYVGQREMAVSERGDWVEVLGSEDATTCHIVIMRDLTSDRGVTGLAHLDSEDPAQLLALEAAVRQRSGSGGPWEYEVSLVGGYDDDRSCSRDITDTLLFTMQNHSAVFRLSLACVLSVNTEKRVGVDWPRTYGAAVSLDTGEVFRAAFESHGPDPDIRSMWAEEGLHNIYCHQTGHIVIKPFVYGVSSSAHKWIEQSDEFLLTYCSTSPKVEPPTFCDMIRAQFQRMITDPNPLETLFRGGVSRAYHRDELSGLWIRIEN